MAGRQPDSPDLPDWPAHYRPLRHGRGPRRRRHTPDGGQLLDSLQTGSREGPEAERSRSLAWRFRGDEPPPPHRPTSMDRVAPESPNEKPPVAVGAVRCVGAAVPLTGLNERVGEREGRLVSFFFASIKPGVVCWPTGRTQRRGCGWTSGAEQKSGLPEAMHQSWVSYRAVRLRPQT